MAVKRIDGEERGEKAFKSEVAAIASVQHVNLARLLGYCIASTGPRFVVYEFVHNGSLDCWIFPNTRAGRRGGCLSWDLRCRVALDVAKALSYLHHDCRSCILHLDVKPENILIDENYRALVSDFGLSKLKEREESRIVTTIRGTRGYLAPEWLLENGVSEKCDVYGYGMVVLEMIGGRRCICVVEKGKGHDSSKRKFQFFPRIVVQKLKEGKLMEVVDDRLLDGGGVDERELRRLVGVALWCIQEAPKRRPTMAEVVEMLEGRRPVEEAPDTQMLVVDLLAVDEDEDDEEEHHGNHRRERRPQPRLVQVDRDVPSSSSSAYSLGFSTLSGR